MEIFAIVSFLVWILAKWLNVAGRDCIRQPRAAEAEDDPDRPRRGGGNQFSQTVASNPAFLLLSSSLYSATNVSTHASPMRARCGRLRP